MEANNGDRLVKYQMTNNEVVVGFTNFQDAEDYAAQNLGDLVEVAFKDGNDNPKLNNSAGLIAKKLHYYVDAGPEYQFIHSADPAFRDYADELQEIQSKLERESPEEKYFANGEPQIAEDPIIVLKNKEFESVTSRERSKYLKQAKVYEIGVSLPLKND